MSQPYYIMPVKNFHTDAPPAHFKGFSLAMRSGNSPFTQVT